MTLCASDTARLRKRADIYRNIHPSTLSPNERRQVRAGLISSDLILCWYKEPLLDGSLNDQLLKRAQDEADVLAEEYGAVNSQYLRYTTLCCGARIRWMRYELFKRLLANGAQGTLEEAELLSQKMRRDQATWVTIESLKTAGLHFLIAVSAQSRDLDTSDHYFLALSHAVEHLMVTFRRLQASFTTKGSTRSKEASANRRDLRIARETLALWIQRSKARSIMEILGMQMPLPDPETLNLTEESEARRLLHE